QESSSGCCSSESGKGGCCGGSSLAKVEEKIGYSIEDIDANNAEASFGLGCGNPKAIASLQPGETVLDLGCGAGFDLLLASKEVGEEGYLIGVDLTPEMIEKAKKNAAKNNLTNSEFHLADIEDLPLEDNSVDVIMSNCVINLTTDKEAVYREAFRVLKPGGRLAIADVLKKQEMPEELREDINNYIECIAGAISKQKLENILAGLNYNEIEVKAKRNSDEIVNNWSDELRLSDYIFSAYITAKKPAVEFSAEEYARLAGALGNAHRVEILKILAAQPADARCMVGSLVDQLPISQSTVSQHLKVLKEAGWIIGQTDGPRTCYCLNDETARNFKVLTEGLI
ncbi:MAG: arsenite methyltransferase, partial [Bacillota bacterium]